MKKFIVKLSRGGSTVIKYLLSHLSLIIVIVAVVWHLFFTDIDYFDICHNDEKIRALQKEIADEKRQIELLEEEIRISQSDATTIERIAREKHGMQQSHEDVYITIPPPDTLDRHITKD